MNINEYTNSLIENRRESIEEATVEELKKAAALHAQKTQNVEKGLTKVDSIANRIKSKVNKESTDGGSGVGKKIAAGVGAAGITLAGAGIVAKKIVDKKKEKEQENVAESVLVLFESVKLINKPSKETGYPSTNLKIDNINISITDSSGDMDKKLIQLEKDFPEMKKIYRSKLEDYFCSWLVQNDFSNISKTEILKGLTLYEIVYDYYYLKKDDIYETAFEFCYNVDKNSKLAQITSDQPVAFVCEFRNNKLYKISAHDI